MKVHAQNRTITGKVTDSITGLPLVSCSIYSLDSGEGVITDEDGKYIFTVNDKTDSIGISMVGYKAIVKRVSKDTGQVINFVAAAFYSISCRRSGNGKIEIYKSTKANIKSDKK